jgi:hypothetical protein
LWQQRQSNSDSSGGDCNSNGRGGGVGSEGDSNGSGDDSNNGDNGGSCNSDGDVDVMTPTMMKMMAMTTMTRQWWY